MPRRHANAKGADQRADQRAPDHHSDRLTDRLTSSYSATLALLEQAAPLALAEEVALARRIQTPVRTRADAERRRVAREALWQANLRLCWRVAVRATTGDADAETRLDVFQTVALALWQKTEQFRPPAAGAAPAAAGRRPARFGSYVMPTLRSVAARCRINDQPVRRPVWVVARERQAARRVRATLAASGGHWDELGAREAEAQMLVALEQIADELRAQAAAALLATGRTSGSRAFRASAVLDHPPVTLTTSAGMGAGAGGARDGSRRRTYGAYAPQALGASAMAEALRAQHDHGQRLQDDREHGADPLDDALSHAGHAGQALWMNDPFAAEEPSADAVAERAGMLESLSPETMALVRQLDARAVEVLRLRFEQNLELKRIGELLDPPLTRARVGQILQDSLATLRALDGAQGGLLHALLRPSPQRH